MKENYDIICDKVEHIDITSKKSIKGNFMLKN